MEKHHKCCIFKENPLEKHLLKHCLELIFSLINTRSRVKPKLVDSVKTGPMQTSTKLHASQRGNTTATTLFMFITPCIPHIMSWLIRTFYFLLKPVFFFCHLTSSLSKSENVHFIYYDHRFKIFVNFILPLTRTHTHSQKEK